MSELTPEEFEIIGLQYLKDIKNVIGREKKIPIIIKLFQVMNDNPLIVNNHSALKEKLKTKLIKFIDEEEKLKEPCQYTLNKYFKKDDIIITTINYYIKLVKENNYIKKDVIKMFEFIDENYEFIFMKNRTFISTIEDIISEYKKNPFMKEICEKYYKKWFDKTNKIDETNEFVFACENLMKLEQNYSLEDF